MRDIVARAVVVLEFRALKAASNVINFNLVSSISENPIVAVSSWWAVLHDVLAIVS